MEIPTYLSSMARGLLGHDYKRQYRFQRGKSLREADVTILLGVTCDFRLNYGRSLSRRSKIISVNNNKTSLYMNQPIFYKATVNLHMPPDKFILNKKIQELRYLLNNKVRK